MYSVTIIYDVKINKNTSHPSKSDYKMKWWLLVFGLIYNHLLMIFVNNKLI